MKTRWRAVFIAILGVILVMGTSGCMRIAGPVNVQPNKGSVWDTTEEPAPMPDVQEPCVDDFDCDGLPDADEIAGITLYGTQEFEKCTGGPRDQCVDPASRDLFVILERGLQGKHLFQNRKCPIHSST